MIWWAWGLDLVIAFVSLGIYLNGVNQEVGEEGDTIQDIGKRYRSEHKVLSIVIIVSACLIPILIIAR